MAVGAQIDTSERETGSAKIPLLNGDQVHEATKVTGQYQRADSRARAARRHEGAAAFSLRLIRARALCNPRRGRRAAGRFCLIVGQLAVREAGLDRARKRERARERGRERDGA